MSRAVREEALLTNVSELARVQRRYVHRPNSGNFALGGSNPRLPPSVCNALRSRKQPRIGAPLSYPISMTWAVSRSRSTTAIVGGQAREMAPGLSTNVDPTCCWSARCVCP